MISVSHTPYAHQPEHNNYQNQEHGKTAHHQQHLDLDLDLDSQAPPDFSSTTTAPLGFDDISSSMLADTWGGLAQYQPDRVARFTHQRESSLSSLGSTGPASPYTQNTSNPHIAVPDSTTLDDFSDMHNHDSASQGASFYPFTKPMGNACAGYQSLDQAMPEMAYPATIQGLGGRQRADRSCPTSVASSVAGDSPATPSGGGVDNDVDRRRKGGYGNMAKLDRTMTDVYSDELYSPNFTITSTPPSQPHNLSTISPPNDIFSQRLSAVNSQHMGVSQSPASSMSRGQPSPFRAGSPFASTATGQEFMAGTHGGPMNTAQRMREHSKAQNDVQMFRQQLMPGAEPETPPKTISPKDAILEFHETDGNADFPLFPQNPADLNMDQLAKTMPQQSNPQQLMANVGGSADQFSYMSSQLPTGMQMASQVPQQYPFIARTQPSSTQSPPRLSPSASNSESGGSTPANMARPAGASADGGTYTCTYHGCTMRFETPMLLQKHKREGHRQSHGLTVTRVPEDMGMTSNMLNSQAGPHRCDRINPNTGKPCHTVFSRPYDLTRHEDTIHNARKQKVRCDLCTEDKTFSRADALTRHYRVCHPDMELPGKIRRRGGG